MGERAARWFRVSSDGQDEQNQFAKVDAHIANRGYEVARTFTLHGDSAFHGEQEPELAEVLADITAGLYSVVVVRHSDRLDRRDPVTALMYALQIMAAGGRVESVEEAEFGKRSTVGLIQTTLSAVGNNEESRKKSERVKDAHARSRANGALTGKYPWGFASKGAKYHRQMVTTAEGERYAPEAFQRIADSAPLPAVARDLSTATGRTWHPRTVAAMIRNTTYRGEHRDAAGRIVCQCPPLVTGDLWRKANANLDARPSARRGQRFDLTDGAALLSGIVFCGNPECDATGDNSPMYRIAPVGREPLYRCSGRGAQRRGCGFMIPVANADTLMNRVMSGLRRPVLEGIPHPAEGHQIELDNVQQALDDLPRRGLSRAEKRAEEDLLWAEEDRLRALPMKAAWTEYVLVLDEAGEPVTYGSRWASSDQAARRMWLRDAGFAVYLATPGMTSQAGPDEDEHPGETFSRTDVYTSDSAALIFEWAGDEDAGLGRTLN